MMIKNSAKIDKHDLVAAIAAKVRITTTAVLGKVSWNEADNPTRAAQMWVRRQAADGLLTFKSTLSHPLLDLSAPLLDWSPGEHSPNFGKLSYQAKRRYSERLSLQTTVSATVLAKNRFGGGLPNRPVRARELDHDIGVSQVFFHLLQYQPELAAMWLHEDSPCFPRHYRSGDKVPDALIKSSPEIVVEFGGRYSAKKLREIHTAFGGGRYMLW